MSTENKGSKIAAIAIGTVVVAGVALAALYLVDVDQTKEAQLPDVNVEVEDGQMPAFDVDVADVEVGTKEVDVAVPTADVKTKTIEVEVPTDVDVGTKDTKVKVPTIDVDKPAEDSPDNDPN